MIYCRCHRASTRSRDGPSPTLPPLLVFPSCRSSTRRPQVCRLAATLVCVCVCPDQGPHWLISPFLSASRSVLRPEAARCPQGGHFEGAQGDRCQGQHCGRCRRGGEDPGGRRRYGAVRRHGPLLPQRPRCQLRPQQAHRTCSPVGVGSQLFDVFGVPSLRQLVTTFS